MASTFFESVVNFSNQHFAQPFLWLDKKGKILRASQALAQQFEYDMEALKDLSIFYLFPTLNILQWNKHLKALEKGSKKMDMQCMTQSEKEFSAKIKLSRIENGGNAYIFIHFSKNQKEVTTEKSPQKKSVAIATNWKTKLSEQTFNRIKEMVFWVKPDGQFFMANDAVVKKLGYTREELLGMKVWEVSAEFPTLVWEEHWKRIKATKFVRFDSVWFRKDKSPVAIDLSLHYVQLDGKEYINAIAHDINKKLQREDLIEMTYQTLNNSSDLVIWSKQDGSIMYFNEAVTKKLGYEKEEFKKMRGKDVVANFTSQNRTQATSKLMAQKRLDGEVMLKKKSGGIIITELSASIFELQGEMITCSIFRDITVKKAREDRLRELLLENQELRLELEGEVSYLQEEIKQAQDFKDIVTVSDNYKKVLDLVQQVASSNTTVLLTGETGTGKELLARAIHGRSNRAEKPLIKINCGALPESLIESELFGHEKGAFTGADKQKKGKFELAHNGTIFLDEIGEMPLSAQVKLLRVLQEGELMRLGGEQNIQIDVRVIAATNRNLRDMMRTKAFREDLFYRLNVFPIKNLPLRERKEDIPALVEHFMRKYSIKRARKVTILPSRSRKKLMAYDFPGNIRELENIVERAVILSKSKFLSLQHWDLPEKIHSKRSLAFKPFEDMQKDYIAEVLSFTNGKVSGTDGAAAILKMNGKTLDSKMRKFGLNRNDFTTDTA